jgi:hypothetical protein
MPFQDHPKFTAETARIRESIFPCSFPDHSLFQFASEDNVPRPKCCPAGLYGPGPDPNPSKFRVFFPVSRQFSPENISHATTSSASQSPLLSLFLGSLGKPRHCAWLRRFGGRSLGSHAWKRGRLYEFSCCSRKVQFRETNEAAGGVKTPLPSALSWSPSATTPARFVPSLLHEPCANRDVADPEGCGEPDRWATVRFLKLPSDGQLIPHE